MLWVHPRKGLGRQIYSKETFKNPRISWLENEISRQEAGKNIFSGLPLPLPVTKTL